MPHLASKAYWKNEAKECPPHRWRAACQVVRARACPIASSRGAACARILAAHRHANVSLDARPRDEGEKGIRDVSRDYTCLDSPIFSRETQAALVKHLPAVFVRGAPSGLRCARGPCVVHHADLTCSVRRSRSQAPASRRGPFLSRARGASP